MISISFCTSENRAPAACWLLPDGYCLMGIAGGRFSQADPLT